jgi:hypothetical protein
MQPFFPEGLFRVAKAVLSHCPALRNDGSLPVLTLHALKSQHSAFIHPEPITVAVHLN